MILRCCLGCVLVVSGCILVFGWALNEFWFAINSIISPGSITYEILNDKIRKNIITKFLIMNGVTNF